MRRPRLQPADLGYIATLCQQGETAPRIAQLLGLTDAQVRRALRRQGLTPTRAIPSGRKPSRDFTGLLCAEQQQLMERFAASKLTVATLAKRLRIGTHQLYQELRGTKAMVPRRLRRVSNLLQSLGA